MAELKTIGHIQIKIQMPNPSQEPPASSISPNENLKDIDVLCKTFNQDPKDMDFLWTLKIQTES